MSPKKRASVFDDGTRSRLAALGADNLAQALLKLAEHHPDAADLVERMLATPQDNLKRVKAKLAGLRRGRSFVDWRDVPEFSRQLEGILEDIRSGVPNPAQGAELVASFFECDKAVFERCDDSSGIVGDVFRLRARDLFVLHAAKCADKARLADRLFKLYGQDDYGVRGCLLDQAAEFLPSEELRQLAERFWEGSKQEPKDSFGGSHWLLGVEALAGQLKDPVLFEKARLTAWPKMSPAACLDIARAYLTADDARTALNWVEKVPEQESFNSWERDELLLAIHQRLGNQEKAEDTVWRLFRRSRGETSLKQLLSVIGEGERGQVIQGESTLIREAKALSYSDATFLLKVGKVAEAESYLMGHHSEINGDRYDSVLPLAEDLERQGRPLVATVLYRALLDSILRRGQSTIYHHAVRYLRKLDTLANGVGAWGDVQPHEAYKEGLRQSHGRKSSFWGKYQV